MRAYLVSGLAELLTCAAIKASYAPNKGSIVFFFGAASSIPDPLRLEFLATAPRFGFDTIIDASELGKEIAALAPPTSLADIVDRIRLKYGHFKLTEIVTNALDKGFVAGMIKIYPSARVIFYDNGLFSHLDTPIYDGDWRIRRRRGGPIARTDMARVSHAYLSLKEYLPIPDYLANTRTTAIPALAIKRCIRRCSNALSANTHKLKFGSYHVIVGTAFYKSGKISWSDERDAYISVCRDIQSQGGVVGYKEHPRATESPLLTKSDGVIELSPRLPLELLLSRTSVTGAYSISSSAVFMLHKLFSARMHVVGRHLHEDTLPPVAKLFRCTVDRFTRQERGIEPIGGP